MFKCQALKLTKLVQERKILVLLSLPSMLKDVDILTLDTLCDPSSEYMHVERPV